MEAPLNTAQALKPTLVRPLSRYAALLSGSGRSLSDEDGITVWERVLHASGPGAGGAERSVPLYHKAGSGNARAESDDRDIAAMRATFFGLHARIQAQLQHSLSSEALPGEEEEPLQ